MNGRRATPKTLTRRSFLRLGAAGLAGALLGAAGCGSERSGKPTRLVFSHGPEGAEIWRRQIGQFNARNEGGIRVEPREAPADTGQYFEMLRTQFRAGGDAADVISGDVIWPAQFAANGWIADLSDRFTADLQERHLRGAINSNTYEGGVYGVPWFTDAGMMYYRKDLLEESGFPEPPKTWDELKEQARKVKQDAGIRYGFVFQGAEYEGGVVNGLEFIWNAGGEVLNPDDPDEVEIGSPEAVEGLEISRGMVEDGVSPEAVASFKELETYAIFLNGDSVFMRNWPFAYALSADRSLSSVEPERIGVAPLPTARAGEPSYSGLGGWNLMINAATGDVDAAWSFIRYLSAPEQQKQRALEGGYLPTLRDLYEDREILDRMPVAALGKEAIRNVRARPSSPRYYELSQVMARRFHDAITGSIPPEEAARLLHRELEDVLR